MKNNQQGHFSPEVMRLFNQIKETTDSEERGELLLQLARQYANCYDATEGFFTETFHGVLDEYHRQFLEYNQAGLRLGRVLMRVIEDEPSVDVLDGSLPQQQVKQSVPN